MSDNEQLIQQLQNLEAQKARIEVTQNNLKTRIDTMKKSLHDQYGENWEAQYERNKKVVEDWDAAHAS